jgi:hypothetical protein
MIKGYDKYDTRAKISLKIDVLNIKCLRHIRLYPVHGEIDFEVYQKLYSQYTR